MNTSMTSFILSILLLQNHRRFACTYKTTSCNCIEIKTHYLKVKVKWVYIAPSRETSKAHLSTLKGWKAESAWLPDLQRTVYRHKWSPVSCRSSAGQSSPVKDRRSTTVPRNQPRAMQHRQAVHPFSDSFIHSNFKQVKIIKQSGIETIIVN